MSLWERSITLSLKPYEYDPVEMVETVAPRVQVEKPNKPYQARAMRWANIKWSNNKKLSKVIDVKKNFKLRPFSYTHQEISPL